MMQNRVLGLLTGVAALGLVSALAFGEPPGGGGGKPPVEKPADEGRIPAAIKVLTDQGLQDMLTNMGYEPKVDKGEANNFYTISIVRDTWALSVEVSLSTSKTKVWLTAWMPKLPENGKIPADRLLNLLEANWNFGPSHFRYYKPFNELSLGMALDNRDLTPAAMRSALEDFCLTIINTEPLWNVTKWSEPLERPTLRPEGQSNDLEMLRPSSYQPPTVLQPKRRK